MDNTRPNSSFFAAQIQTPFNVQTLTLLLIVAVWEMSAGPASCLPISFRQDSRSCNLFGDISRPRCCCRTLKPVFMNGGALSLAALTGIPLGILWGSRSSWLQIVEPLILYAA